MIHLQRNLPTWERVVRLILSALTTLVLLLIAMNPWWKAAGIGLAALLGATAFIGFCPACAMVGRRPA